MRSPAADDATYEVRVRKVIAFEYTLDAESIHDPAFLTRAGAEDQAQLERDQPIHTAIDAWLESTDRDRFTVISSYVEVRQTK